MSNDNQNTANQLDETVPGGAYVKEGVVVDGEGKPKHGWSVDADGNAVGPTLKGKKGQETGAAIDPNASTNSAATTSNNEKLGG